MRALGLGLVLLLAGCRGGEEARRPVYAEPQPPYVPREGSGDAFDQYALAALDVERLGDRALARSTYYPPQRDRTLKEIAPALARVERATGAPCRFRFVPRPPFAQAPYVRGWRLIARGFVWRMEDQLEAGQVDAAIATGVRATRFGFDLTQGDAVSADLGLTLVDEVRALLLPRLGGLSVAQLTTLRRGLKSALPKDLTECARNEAAQGRMAAQWILESAEKGELGELRRGMGADGEPVAKALSGRRGAALYGFLNPFDAEAKARGEAWIRMAERPTVQRAELEPKVDPKRPWRRLAKHFLGAYPVALRRFDQTLARTRLFIVEADLRRVVLGNRPLPSDLSGLEEAVRTDPYSGASLGYRTDGVTYQLYSVGEDGLDDGGDTDEAALRPDIGLERP